MIINFTGVDTYLLSLPIQTNVQVLRSGIVYATFERPKLFFPPSLMGVKRDLQ